MTKIFIYAIISILSVHTLTIPLISRKNIKTYAPARLDFTIIATTCRKIIFSI